MFWMECFHKRWSGNARNADWFEQSRQSLQEHNCSKVETYVQKFLTLEKTCLWLHIQSNYWLLGWCLRNNRYKFSAFCIGYGYSTGPWTNKHLTVRAIDWLLHTNFHWNCQLCNRQFTLTCIHLRFTLDLRWVLDWTKWSSWTTVNWTYNQTCCEVHLSAPTEPVGIFMKRDMR